MVTEEYIFQVSAVENIFKNFNKLYLQIHRNIVV